MNLIGIDIGTTTISLVLIEKETGKLIAKDTITHESFLSGEIPEMKIQEPEKILSVTLEKLGEWMELYGRPAGIGFTGQMHGMLYVDKDGNAVSPFYTWQDECGNLPLQNGKSSVEMLKEAANNSGTLASGYGIVTHYYLKNMGCVPENGIKMSTISDYIIMKLCGKKEPVIGMDMAASWGGFDLKKKEFCVSSLEAAGVAVSYLPEVKKNSGIVAETIQIGKIPAKIPVSISIGDNQASFLGAVGLHKEAVLVNIGTGSQVSYVSEKYVDCSGNIELRPYGDNRYLLVGASLCGGRAYAMLEKFYREVSGTKDTDYYEVMEKQAKDFLEHYGISEAWNVRTTFSGTRTNPKERGQITNIGVENFHPGAFTVGVMKGIIEELFCKYQVMSQLTGKKAKHLIGAGNGMRKNKLMQKLTEDMFELPMELSNSQEEAACGAAYFLSGLLV